MLQEKFVALSLKYIQDESVVAKNWNEIETAYTSKGRYFHNLHHLQQLIKELEAVQHEISDWDVVLFTMFYHDIAYDVVQYVVQNDNEERSAVVAENALKAIHFPHDKLEKCKQHILATKTHEITSDNDSNIFIDADLSILGQPWNVYEAYMKNIRKEFAVYPDNIFHRGRTRVLNKFLNMERMFKTDHFYNLYEGEARENISRELEILSIL